MVFTTIEIHNFSSVYAHTHIHTNYSVVMAEIQKNEKQQQEKKNQIKKNDKNKQTKLKMSEQKSKAHFKLRE